MRCALCNLQLHLLQMHLRILTRDSQFPFRVTPFRQIIDRLDRYKAV